MKRSGIDQKEESEQQRSGPDPNQRWPARPDSKGHPFGSATDGHSVSPIANSQPMVLSPRETRKQPPLSQWTLVSALHPKQPFRHLTKKAGRLKHPAFSSPRISKA